MPVECHSSQIRQNQNRKIYYKQSVVIYINRHQTLSILLPTPWCMSTDYSLDKEEVVQFHRDGYLGPFTLCSPEEMAEYRERVPGEVREESEYAGPPSRDRHLDSPTVYDLCSHPALVDRLASILGPDVTLWRSFIFQKGPGGDSFPWHQDSRFWDVQPPIAITAWIALTDAKEDNGCVRLVPGSHEHTVPHLRNEDGDGFTFEADPEYVDEEAAVSMELEPGQFVLFYNHTIHGSLPNTSDRNRLGIAARVATPYVLVSEENPVLLLSGEDRQGINEVGEPPTA